MTGRRCYLTTIAGWQRHATRCVEAHFILLDGEDRGGIASQLGESLQTGPAQAGPSDTASEEKMIFVLVTADEAAHIAFENDPDVEPLPHPLSRAPIPERAAAALARFGVMQGDDMFTAAEKLARIHPLLKHRVF